MLLKTKVVNLDIESKIEKARRIPKDFFSSNIEKITYIKENDDIEDVITLLIVSAFIDEPYVYNELLNYVSGFDEFAENMHYQYYYFLSKASYFKQIDELDKSIKNCMIVSEFAYKLKRSNYIVEALKYIGSVYHKKKEYELALSYTEEAIKRSIRCDNISLVANVYMLYGVILIDIQKYKHAIRAYETSKLKFETTVNYESHIQYALLHLNLGEAHLFDDNSKVADIHYQIGLELTDKYGHGVTFKNVYLMLSTYYDKIGNHEKNIECLKAYIEVISRDRSTKNVLEEEENNERFRSTVGEMNNLKSRNEILLRRINYLNKEMNSKIRNLNINNKIVGAINRGIEKNEILTFYQSKWSIEKDRVVGAEALVRWNQDGTFIPPGIFINQIEESDVIIDVSKIVIRDAIRMCKKIVDNVDSDFVISVNIAPYQLANQNIKDFIEAELVLNNLAPKNFEIEITERSFVDQNPRVLHELASLERLGVKISLDDFGTGYSSLSYLNDLPLDIIKIDRSLILKIDVDKKSSNLLINIINMMHDLDLEVVAEGVETEEQVEFLKSTNCNMIQGYYYSKPSNGEEYYKTLLNEKDFKIDIDHNDIV